VRVGVLVERDGRGAADGQAVLPGGTVEQGTGVGHSVGADADAPGERATEVAPEVLEFIRFCYRRRKIGWPELYDEMCTVAARGLFRAMDYERLNALGVGFSLDELPRLAALAQRVVTEERRRPQSEPSTLRGGPESVGLVPAPAT
jgi:hypothetical protein